MNTVIKIELNSKQQTEFDTWCSHLKAIFGNEGTLTWTVTETGIGHIISVTSSYAPNKPLKITDYDSW